MSNSPISNNPIEQKSFVCIQFKCKKKSIWPIDRTLWGNILKRNNTSNPYRVKRNVYPDTLFCRVICCRHTWLFQLFPACLCNRIYIRRLFKLKTNEFVIPWNNTVFSAGFIDLFECCEHRVCDVFLFHLSTIFFRNELGKHCTYFSLKIKNNASRLNQCEQVEVGVSLSFLDWI